MTSKRKDTEKSVIHHLIGKFIHHIKKKSPKPSFTNDAAFEHTQYQLYRKNRHETIAQHRHSYHLFSPPSPSSSQLTPYHYCCCCSPSCNCCCDHQARPKKKSYHRHYSSLSASNITVHSEDLSSKEFADMVGIQILPETADERHRMATPSLIATSSSKVSSSILLKESDGSSMLFQPTSDIVSLDDEDDLDDMEMAHIWDDGFWQHPNKQTSETLSNVHEMIRYDGAVCIKRGRFEILLTENCASSATIPTKRSDRTVLEWKRRKATCHSTS